MIDRRLFLGTAIAASALPFPANSKATVMNKRFKQFSAVIDAWKRKDKDFIINSMTDDIVWHFAAAIAPPARGKAECRAFIDKFGAGIGAVRWRIFEHAETADRLFVEGVDEYDSTDGHTIKAPYAGVIEFRGDLISGWRDYVDRGVIDAQKRGEAASAQVNELTARPAAQ
ncbi:MAG: nuclear transport factor 2 family protein [Pseudomonadota bacterium]